MDKKRIVLSGYYGYDNAGDEAVLVSILQQLRKNGFEPIVLSGNPEKTRQLYHVKAVHRMDFGAMNAAIRDCDGFISGGGSLLQDVTGPKSVPYYLAVLKLAQTYKKPTFFYSQGVGPVTRKYFHPLIKYIVGGCSYVSVRDIESKRFLESLGLKMEADLSIDPVLGIETSDCSLPADLEQFLKHKPVLISVRKWKDDERVINEMEKVISSLIERDIPVLLLPFHYPGDLDISEKIFSRLPSSDKVFLQRDELNVDQVVSAVSKVRLVVGMRLHSLIIAASQHTPFVGITYDPKIDEFLKQFGKKAATKAVGFSSDDCLTVIDETLSRLDDERNDVREIRHQLLDKLLLPIQYMTKYFEVRP